MTTDLEKRADADSLENLHFERRSIAAVLHPLAAKYGPFGMYDDIRKSLVEAQKVKHRAALAEAGAKTTEGMIDALAYSDPVYVAFLELAQTEKIEYLRLTLKTTEIEEKIRNRETCLNAYNAEIRLGR